MAGQPKDAIRDVQLAGAAVVLGEEDDETDETSLQADVLVDAFSKPPELVLHTEPAIDKTLEKIRGAQLRAEQAERELARKEERDRLAKEQDARMKIHQHNKAVREQVLSQLLGRLQTARSVTGTVHEFFKDRSDIEHTYANASHALANLIFDESAHSKEQGTVRWAIAGVSSFAMEAHQAHLEVSQQLAHVANTRLVSLEAELESTCKEIKERSAKLMKDINASVENVNAKYAAYQRASADSASGVTPLKDDPFAAGIQYKRAVAMLREAETAFNDGAQKLAEDVEVADRRRIDLTRVVLTDFLVSQRVLLTRQLAALEDTLKVVDSISGVDHRLFVARLQDRLTKVLPAEEPKLDEKDDETKEELSALLARCKQLEPPPLVEKLNEALRTLEVPVSYDLNADIVKEGYLSRKSKMLKSWKRNWFVLSRYGFLHYFEERDQPLPEESIALVKCNIETQSEPNTFMLVTHYGGFIRSSKYLLQAESQQIMVDWICALKDHIQHA